LCGPLDENLRQISAALDVTIFRRGEKFIVSGHNAERAVEILEHFYAIANKIVPIEEVQLALVEQRQHARRPPPWKRLPPMAQRPCPQAAQGGTVPAVEIDINSPILKTRRADLRGRTPHQIRYLRNILEHDISFGVGPAGTGKTYLAVACAVDALERDAVKRIILTRPAVEAGERLGFLPGDLSQKVDPYLRPLYDALYDLLGFDRTQKMFEKQVIEIAPLAYMRGRTLNHAFVILDEAQNTTVEQMKMFLTRIGFGSKAVVTGDVTQVDLHKSQKSGLVDAIQVLKDVRGIAFSHFNSEDVVRHPLVARIVDAYETAHNHEAEIAPLLKATALKNVRKNKLTLSVQYADPACRKPSPVPKSASGAGRAVRAGRTDHPLCRCRRRPALNREYRGKDYATNVLTFAYNEGEEELPEDAPTQADIILCTDVLEKEAAEQKKTVEEHTAHLIVHGVLHAQGYDHMDDEEAAEMEGIETEILAELGYADPYASERS
jgi:phosphate starvation-inducible PhoH-like protein